MSSASDHPALVALLRHGRRAAPAYSDLLEEAGSALAVLEQDRLFSADELDAASEEIRTWNQEGITLASVLDHGYPENLRAVHDRPPLIFVAGELRPEDARSIAVIGSRKATREGVATVTAVAGHLVERGFTVVSGLAAGIDTAAHTAALEAGGRTVAVIGTGLKHSYPPQNARLQRRIAADHAVISQFWPDTPPSRRTFPMRNAVMSGITLATVIVEASHSSGARVQSRLALAQGRPVFLLERLLEQEWARELATRPGTHVVREPEQITATVERLTAADALVS
jgi:DNA processing protein